MSSTCFEPEGSSSGGWLTMQFLYGMFYMHRYKQSSRKKRPIAILFYLLHNHLPDNEPLGSKHEELKVKHYRVKKNQLDAQLILSKVRQPLHVSGISSSIIRRYNHMYTSIGAYYSFQMPVCCPGWIGTRTTDSHLKRIISTNCCIHTVKPPDDGPRYA